MARKPRVHLAGAVYHVIARGNNRETVFQCEADKETYLQLLSHYKERFNYRIYAYVLIDNHIHLLISVAEQPLSKIMQGLQLSYTQYYNKKYNRVGHVFQQRYKAMLCMQDRYLLSLIKYIHVNPVKAGLSDDLNYRWSSHKQYIKPSSALVDTEFILRILASNREQGLDSYRNFMCAGNSEVIDPQQCYISNFADIEAEIVDQHALMNANEVLHYVSTARNISVELLCGLSRIKSVLEARKVFIYLAIKYCSTPAVELAEMLKISPPQISRGFHAVVCDGGLRQQAEKNYDSLREMQLCKA